jgi:hypothetical protein
VSRLPAHVQPWAADAQQRLQPTQSALVRGVAIKPTGLPRHAASAASSRHRRSRTTTPSLRLPSPATELRCRPSAV